MSVLALTGDVRFPLPDRLKHLGETGCVRLCGNPDGASVLLLGGISGDRFACEAQDGSKGWWHRLAGPGRTINPQFHRMIALDLAADETGRIAPSTADQAEVVISALDACGIQRLDLLIGASYGGMVGLVLAANHPQRLRRLVIISACAEPHPSATAARELQRRIVELGIASGNAEEALAIARGMAMLTYRTSNEFALRFSGGIADPSPLSESEPGRYLRARGEAFTKVMSPGRFLSLSGSIDRHKVDPAEIRTPTLLVGAHSDLLVPPAQMKDLADRLAGRRSLELRHSLYGHDMFLKEAEAIGALVQEFAAP